jgi:hypothetical protein
MMRSIDEMMYLSDGINPFGVGIMFKLTPYNFRGVGSMNGKALEKQGQTEYEIEDTINKNESVVKKSSDKHLIKQYFDVYELPDTEMKNDVINLIEDEFENRNININNIDEPKYEKFIDKKGKIIQPLYYYADLYASKDDERGDETEEILKVIPELFEDVDKDNSEIFNTKDYKNILYWSDEFKDIINEDIAKHFPVDEIKKNTIWEIKSYKKPLSESVKLSDTKIDGTNEYDIVYKNYPSNGGVKTKIENIYYLGKDKTKYIPTLKENENGYDYYIGFNLKDKFAHYKPLEDDKFEKQYDSTDNVRNLLFNTNTIDENGKIINWDFPDELVGYVNAWDSYKRTKIPIISSEKIDKNDLSHTFKGTFKYNRIEGYEGNRNKEYLLDNKKVSYFPHSYINKYSKKVKKKYY